MLHAYVSALILYVSQSMTNPFTLGTGCPTFAITYSRHAMTIPFTFIDTANSPQAPHLVYTKRVKYSQRAVTGRQILPYYSKNYIRHGLEQHIHHRSDGVFRLRTWVILFLHIGNQNMEKNVSPIKKTSYHHASSLFPNTDQISVRSDQRSKRWQYEFNAARVQSERATTSDCIELRIAKLIRT